MQSEHIEVFVFDILHPQFSWSTGGFGSATRALHATEYICVSVGLCGCVQYKKETGPEKTNED